MERNIQIQKILLKKFLKNYLISLTLNINILKGGTENNEFYSSFTTKFSINQVNNITEPYSLTSADLSFLTQSLLNDNSKLNNNKDINNFR